MGMVVLKLELNAERLEALAYEFKRMLDDSMATVANLNVLLAEKDRENERSSQLIAEMSSELDEFKERLRFYEEKELESQSK